MDSSCDIKNNLFLI